MLELTHPTPGSDTVDWFYEYFNNGTGSGLMPLGSYDHLFDNLNYTQAGLVQLVPVPEPSSLALLAPVLPGLLAFTWRKRWRECT